MPKKRNLYVPKTTPMNHQKLALEACRAKPKDPCPDDVFAYLMDTGTGKTKSVLDEWGEAAVNGGWQNLLVIAPAGSYRNWCQDKTELKLSELNTHLNPRLREDLVDAMWISGGNRENRERLRLMLETRGRPRALFMNVEALSATEKAREFLLEFLESCQRRGGVYCVIDESTVIRNNSKRTKFINQKVPKLTQARRILTGLLTPRSPLDTYHQFEFLSPKILGFSSAFSFKARYAVTRKMTVRQGERERKIDVIVGYRNVEEIREKIAPYSYRVLKEDCLDLPPKTYVMRDVELTEVQWKHYRELKQHATTMLAGGKYVTAETILALMIRLHQINLGYVVDEDGVFHELPERRTDGLVEMLDEHRGKAVVWCPWRAPIEKIVRRLQKEFGPKCVAQFHGGNKGSRHEEEARFLGDPECRFMIATQGAGMRGNTWIEANLNVYYANDHDLEKRYQSEDRIYRKGQQQHVTIADLITQGTVDTKILKALRQKIDLATVLAGENYREWLI